jgi:hypothetical protein
VDYRIQPITASDEEITQIEYLFNQTLSKNRINSEYLNWLYKENPDGLVIGYNAFFNDELIAHYAVIPTVLKFRNIEERWAWSLNTITHPEHQRKGLFTLLANKTLVKLKTLGYCGVLGVANKNSIHTFTQKLNFIILGKLNIFLNVYSKINYNKYVYRSFDDRMKENWRIKRIDKKYYKDSTVKYKCFHVFSPIIRQNEISLLKFLHLYIALKKPVQFFGVKLPKFLRPTHWEAIAYSINTQFPIADIQIEFLDNDSI